MTKEKLTAILLPGFGGSADQPILVSLSGLLKAHGITAVRLAPPAGRPSPNLEAETDWLLGEIKKHGKRVCLVGRSFGARLAIRASVQTDLVALGLLGFPIRPPKKRRPEDERVLHSLTVPTLLIQGSVDELGPLRVVQATVKNNENIQLSVLKGAGHSFGKHEPEALRQMAQWLAVKRDGL